MYLTCMILEFMRKVGIGFTGGVLGCCVNIPFDVAKSRYTNYALAMFFFFTIVLIIELKINSLSNYINIFSF